MDKRHRYGFDSSTICVACESCLKYEEILKEELVLEQKEAVHVRHKRGSHFEAADSVFSVAGVVIASEGKSFEMSPETVYAILSPPSAGKLYFVLSSCRRQLDHRITSGKRDESKWYLSSREFEKLLFTSGLDWLERAQLDRIYLQFDLNQSGSLHVSELCAVLMRAELLCRRILSQSKLYLSFCLPFFSDSRMDVPGMFSPKAFSPLLAAVTPNPSVLIQYPLFLTMARVTVHSELLRGRSALVASLMHGNDLYTHYGLFALYRGLPVYLAHSLGTTLLRHPTKRIKSKKTRIASRLAVDACTYPLLVACTRMAAYTTGDSQWAFADCLKSTVHDDGWAGLWAGAAPFLLVSAYKELEELAFEYMKAQTVDETDAAVLGFVRLALGAVLTSPFLTMSTIIRCQSNNPALLTPTSHSEVFAKMPWKWNLVGIAVVAVLGAVNIAIIREKNSIPDEPSERRRTVSPSMH